MDRLVPLPDSISFEQAAAVMLQGLTAHYLVNDSHILKHGETVLIHACAGGVGLLLAQLCKLKGAKVLGIVSSPEKSELAKTIGKADECILTSDDWVKYTKESFAAKKKGVDVVYDSVGTTLRSSISAARIGGHVVFYGMANGNPECMLRKVILFLLTANFVVVDPRLLMDESKSLTGGDLWNVLTDHSERVKRSNELFQLIELGKLHVEIAKSFPLKDGAQAHDYLQSRKAVGKVLLIP